MKWIRKPAEFLKRLHIGCFLTALLFVRHACPMTGEQGRELFSDTGYVNES